MGLRGGLLAAAVMATLVAVPPAQAFDTGPHGDLTVDALRSEGFGPAAADVGRVNNWFVDLYSQASNTPFSGHADWYNVVLGGGIGNSEDWSQDVLDAVARSHFDFPHDAFSTTGGEEAEWARLRRAVYGMVQNAKTHRSPLELLTAIGASLHELQDFYSHTNWVEPAGVGIYEAPGWVDRRQGQTPTWFDVPKAARDTQRIYSAGGTGIHRSHGNWKAPPDTSMAKDWPGRPNYTAAYMTGYFASRQWVRAIRAWLGDEALWARTQRYADNLSALRYDVNGAVDMSTYVGRLYGEGGPGKPLWDDTSGWGGSLVALRSVTKAYFEDRGRSIYRRTFETLVKQMAAPAPAAVPEAQIAVPSSRPMQAETRFVRLQIPYMRGIDLGDIGPDDADMYARAVIAGQRYISPIIQAHDLFSFPSPYYPFTFIKSVPRQGLYSEPITDMTVQIKTSSSRFSGTDDDVFLRIGDGQRFALDKRVYDDFERGGVDTYSVPIDAAARAGLTVGDIRYVQVEKSSDGVAGGWKLRGVKLAVNGRTLYQRDNIERWLEDDHRTWRAPDFQQQRPLVAGVPVWFDLREDDLLIYGFDDQGDINPFDGRDAIVRAYVPGAPQEAQVTGGNALGGRLGAGGDKAMLRYRLETLDTTLPLPLVEQAPAQPVLSTPPPDPPPVPKPDLVITAFTDQAVTVKNQGTGAAGPFSVKVNNSVNVPFAGLAAGATLTSSYVAPCVFTYTAAADAGLQIDEIDETNNSSSFSSLCLQ